jgi:hypothetical protein
MTLKRSSTSLRTLAIAGAALVVLMAIVASPALASEVNAKFSASTLKLTSSGLTLKRNGTEAKSCNFKSTPTGETAEGNTAAWVFNEATGLTWVKCAEGKYLTMGLFVHAHFDTSTSRYFLTLVEQGGLTSPWGEWFQSPQGKANGTWVNGSALTPSTLVFEESVIGNTTGGNITLTGTINVTTSSGGLITLSH